MEKWADFCIARVRYNSERTHIVKVEVFVDKGDKLDAAAEWERRQVVSAIEQGKTFVTVFKQNGQWQKGQEVRVITVSGTKYIRTDQNARASDNLQNLPEF